MVLPRRRPALHSARSLRERICSVLPHSANSLAGHPAVATDVKPKPVSSAFVAWGLTHDYKGEIRAPDAPRAQDRYRGGASIPRRHGNQGRRAGALSDDFDVIGGSASAPANGGWAAPDAMTRLVVWTGGVLQPVAPRAQYPRICVGDGIKLARTADDLHAVPSWCLPKPRLPSHASRLTPLQTQVALPLTR